MSTYRTVQLVLVGIIVVLFGASALARRFPDIGWLQVFRYDPPQLSEEQRALMRRRSDINSGIQLILLGIGLPLIYVASTIMFFNDFEAIPTVLVVAGSVVCIGLGVTGIRRSR
jgi:hypothetical protein